MSMTAILPTVYVIKAITYDFETEHEKIVGFVFTEAEAASAVERLAARREAASLNAQRQNQRIDEFAQTYPRPRYEASTIENKISKLNASTPKANRDGVFHASLEKLKKAYAEMRNAFDEASVLYATNQAAYVNDLVPLTEEERRDMEELAMFDRFDYEEVKEGVQL